MSPIEISYVRFHEGVFLPGKLGSLGNTLPPTGLSAAGKEMPGLKMMYTEIGLIVTYEADTFIVPLANISVARYKKVALTPTKA